MNRFILVVCRAADMGREITTLLEDHFGNGAEVVAVDRARSREEAAVRLQAHAYDLVVAEFDIPASRQTSPVADGKEAMELVKSLESSQTPVILLVAATLMQFNVIKVSQAVCNCQLVGMGEDWMDWLLKQAEQVLVQARRPSGKAGQMPGNQEARTGKLTVEVDERENWRYRLEGSGTGFKFNKEGTLEVDRRTLEKVLRWSNEFRSKQDDWQGNLHDIGETLADQLFAGNAIFNGHFNRLLGYVGSKDKIRIEFKVSPQLHPASFEAVLELEETPPWMLLNYPIYRRLLSKTDASAKMSGSERSAPVTCLLIEADTEGRPFAEATSQIEFPGLRKLPNINKEIQEVEACLKECGITPVTVQKQESDETYWQAVVRTAGKQQWDIVHYAGHSYFDAKSNQGFLFFPGKQIPEPVSVDQFCITLERPGLVYLSSCHSSQAPFAFNLAQASIGAVLGFQCEIQDRMAKDFAEAFYRELIKNRLPLEYAFLESRRKMFAQNQQNKIWAVPMLIM